MRVLVVTVVHHPQDARIYFRQIAALLDHGHQVSYAAAFESFPVKELDSRLETINLPRATGRRRFKALLAARELIRQRSIDFDLVLLHDPELLLIANVSKSPVVWDVHEDTAAAITSKNWIPNFLKKPLKLFISGLEQNAEKKYHLLLAESGYQARFKKPQIVIPNTTTVPPYKAEPFENSVVYLGSMTNLRGGQVMLELAEKLAQHQIKLEIIGSCPEPELTKQLENAISAGYLVWHGFVPNESARNMLYGKIAGISLLQNHPNYMVSQPTKIYEYLAAGLPVISTPLPHAKELIDSADCGFVVNFDNADEALAAILKLKSNPALWQKQSHNGHSYVVRHHNWIVDQEKFIHALEGFVAK